MPGPENVAEVFPGATLSPSICPGQPHWSLGKDGQCRALTEAVQ